MLKFRIRTTDLRRVEQALRKTKEELADRSRALQEVKEYMIERWEFNFGTQGAIYGKWQGLRDSTIDQRRAEGFGAGPILYKTGWLFSRFSSANRRGRVNRASIAWNMGGGDDERLLHHHFGSYNKPASTRAGRTVRNPSRLLWDINQEDENFTADKLEDWAEAIFNRHFGA